MVLNRVLRGNHEEGIGEAVPLVVDGRLAFAETVETINPPGEPELVMRFVNIMELNEEGLIAKLDIFWKTPPRMPPEWITPEAILDDAGG